MRLLAFVLAFLLVPGCAFVPKAPIKNLEPSTERLEARPGGVGSRDSIRYVIHISIDGLRPDAVLRRSAEDLPAFTRLRTEGLSTQNARTDVDFRNTLPNHTAQLTSRPVLGPNGHNWTVNRYPVPGATLHSHKGSYVTSVFDVAHDAGLRTGAYVSKSKFALFSTSYDAAHASDDLTGPDNGRNKIDSFVYIRDTGALLDAFVRDMSADPFNYAFIHIRDPDSAGHVFGWSVRGSSTYMRAVKRADQRIGSVLDLVESDPELRGHTAVVVTADHGGSANDHSAAKRPHYTVPFYVWGPGIPAADLYAVNDDIRRDPGSANVGFDTRPQPIRNGEAANVSLSLLHLGPIPGSTVGSEFPLRFGTPPRAADSVARQAPTNE